MRVVNVGSSGKAFGIADNTEMTILALLRATDVLTASGADLIYDDGDDMLTDVEGSLRVPASIIYTDVDEGYAFSADRMQGRVYRPTEFPVRERPRRAMARLMRPRISFVRRLGTSVEAL